MMMQDISSGIAWYLIFLFSVIFHEAAHGLAAIRFGDATAYRQGLVSFDPVPHIRRSPVGLVVIPIVSFLVGGWMVGWASTPYDPFWAQQHRRKAALMSLAGPAANLILLLIAAVVIRIGVFSGVFSVPQTVTFDQVTTAESTRTAASAALLLSILFTENLILLAFNLIPLPPLDGSNILVLLLSDKAAHRYESFLHQPTFMLIGLVIAWQVFGAVFKPFYGLALNILYPGAGYH